MAKPGRGSARRVRGLNIQSEILSNLLTSLLRNSSCQRRGIEISFICACSFFSTARRTNQEAPPQLSGFLARRLGRRRGLRNSFRSDSPCPFSSVSLASSPPDKGGINKSFFRFYSTFFFNPSVLRTPPLYFAAQNIGEEGEMYFPFASAPILYVTPRKAMGHGIGGGGLTLSLPLPVFFNPSVTACHLPYMASPHRGGVFKSNLYSLEMSRGEGDVSFCFRY